MKSPVIAVALSGGVDSLVSGYLLKQKFKNVFGIHFTTGYEKEIFDPDILAKQLGLPVTCVDLSKKFNTKVVDYFVQTYLQGKTPNPCIICNKKIKFKELLTCAQNMGADYIATGHYATIINQISFPERKITRCFLEKGADQLKDQSYFLSMLSENQLEKIIFPLAGMEKSQVKKLAVSKGVKPLKSRESQDICFIHDNDFPGFILQNKKITPRHGDIIDHNGKTVGRHKGLHKYTIGQRRGIDCPAREPYYVNQIDIKNNVLKVCFKKYLTRTKMNIAHINWNYIDQKIMPDIITKIRYSHKGALSTLFLNKSAGQGQVVFDQPQAAVTPGQAAVFYKENQILGAGIIQ